MLANKNKEIMKLFVDIFREKSFLDAVILYQQKGFVFRIENLAQAFDSLTDFLTSSVGHFCHMIKLIKYHVTKCPGRSPGAHIQCCDSMSEPTPQRPLLFNGHGFLQLYAFRQILSECM